MNKVPRLDSHGLSPSQYEFLKALPKVELHAHLHGCIRTSTLHELAQERDVVLPPSHFGPDSAPDESFKSLGMHHVQPRSLSDCFAMFGQISRVVTDLAALRRVTMEALYDMAHVRCVYAELRSTPKRLQNASKRDYVETILQVMTHFMDQERERYQREKDQGIRRARLPMTVRFIVSVDRSLSLVEAQENIELAVSFSEQTSNGTKPAGGLVVAVDLGGNPTRGLFADFVPLFQQARDSGLKITLHCGETEDPENNSALSQEMDQILDFGPDRLGHALLMSVAQRQLLLAAGIPVEVCPTSNVMTLELHRHLKEHDQHTCSVVSSLRDHHPLLQAICFQLGAQHHPVIFCTDDPGVFDTNLLREYCLVSSALNLTSEFWTQSYLNNIMSYAFCDDTTKQYVQSQIEEYLEALL
jgi:adenosine deaminase